MRLWIITYDSNSVRCRMSAIAYDMDHRIKSLDRYTDRYTDAMLPVSSHSNESEVSGKPCVLSTMYGLCHIYFQF